MFAMVDYTKEHYEDSCRFLRSMIDHMIEELNHMEDNPHLLPVVELQKNSSPALINVVISGQEHRTVFPHKGSNVHPQFLF